MRSNKNTFYWSTLFIWNFFLKTNLRSEVPAWRCRTKVHRSSRRRRGSGKSARGGCGAGSCWTTRQSHLKNATGFKNQQMHKRLIEIILMSRMNEQCFWGLNSFIAYIFIFFLNGKVLVSKSYSYTLLD